MFRIEYRYAGGPLSVIEKAGATQKEAIQALYLQLGSRLTEIESVTPVAVKDADAAG